VFKVRTATEILERVVLIRRNNSARPALFAILVLPVQQSFDQLQFVRLIAKERARFIGIDNPVDKWMSAGNNAAHPLFDLFQIVGCQWARQVEIVVEPILDGRTDGDFSFGKDFEHCLCHHVRGRMAQTVVGICFWFDWHTQNLVVVMRRLM
jgi:hypothetical protein